MSYITHSSIANADSFFGILVFILIVVTNIISAISKKKKKPTLPSKEASTVDPTEILSEFLGSINKQTKDAKSKQQPNSSAQNIRENDNPMKLFGNEDKVSGIEKSTPAVVPEHKNITAMEYEVIDKSAFFEDNDVVDTFNVPMEYLSYTDKNIAKSKSKYRESVIHDLKDVDSARKAFILKEILDKPVALRTYHLK